MYPHHTRDIVSVNRVIILQNLNHSNFSFSRFIFGAAVTQVECKKAQPKEVMLPANLAKTRAAAGRTYGELVVLSGGSSTAATSVRYAPYPLPPTMAAQHHHHQHQQQPPPHQQHLWRPERFHPVIMRFRPGVDTGPESHDAGMQSLRHQHTPPTQIANPNPSIIQYTTNPQQTLYDAAAALSYKRLLAATAAASLRSHANAVAVQQQHPTGHATTTSLQSRPTPATAAAAATLSYPLSDLLGLQGLDVSTLYGLPPATLGL